jgi:aminoglycoside 6'-N-acetyltransferase I
MRQVLWPDDGDGHAAEIDQYFAGALRMPLEVLLAVAELSIRPYAEDCVTDRVAYLEGWFVEPDWRRRGAGRALVAAAEAWARSQRCTEFASDALIDNVASAAAHEALGFVETCQLRCFRKPLEPTDRSDSKRAP